MHSLSRGISPTVTVRLPLELLERMDRVRALHGLSRSAYLRESLAYNLTVDLEELGEDGAE